MHPTMSMCRWPIWGLHGKRNQISYLDIWKKWSFLCISNTTIEHGCVNLRSFHISWNIPMKMGNFSIVLLYWKPAVPCRWRLGRENFETFRQAKMQLLEPPERPFTLGDPGFNRKKYADGLVKCGHRLVISKGPSLDCHRGGIWVVWSSVPWTSVSFLAGSSFSMVSIIDYNPVRTGLYWEV